MVQTAALTSAAPEFRNLDRSCYPVLQGEKLCVGNLFTSEMLVGREESSLLEGLVNEGNINPAVEGFLYCVYIFL